MLYVSFFDAVRFANWMNNGQGSGDTETGSYLLLGGTATPGNGTSFTRTNTNQTIFVASENEWYKAAYYDPSTASYFDYPARSNTVPTCSTATAAPNRANCNFQVGNLTVGGTYIGSASPYGTFDQGGNVQEWNDTIINSSSRGFRGGSFGHVNSTLAASARNWMGPSTDTGYVGFRLAMIPGGYVPEPSTGLLVIAGLVGLGVHHRIRA